MTAASQVHGWDVHAVRTGRQKSTGISLAARLTIGRMPSYEPVDLSAACNAGVEVLGDEPGDVPLGRVDLRGLPFLIGPEPPLAERCLLLPGAPTSVGIGRLARRVIVAHRLLEPGSPAGHAAGQAVAEYAFHLAGGEVVVAPSGSGSRSRWCRRVGVVCRSSPSPTPATITCRVLRVGGAKPGCA